MDKAVSYKLEAFFTKFNNKTYKKGEILIRADEDPNAVFYLKEGLVKQYVISKKGDELVVNIFRPISFFPMSWAINNTHNDYYFEAVTDVEVWKAPKEEVTVFIKKDPEILYDLLSRIFKGTDGLFRRMTFLMTGNAYARLITELIIQAKRFGTHHSVHPFGTIELKISEKDLAAQTGMSRETVSREMKFLKDAGLVVFNKNILQISNLEKLEEELGAF